MDKDAFYTPPTEMRCRRCNRLLTNKKGLKIRDPVWDLLILGEWRKKTGDNRTVLAGIRLPWCQSCHKLYDRSPRQFFFPPKEVREKLGTNLVKEKGTKESGVIHVGPDGDVHRLSADAQD